MEYEIFKKHIYGLTDINLDLYKEKQMKRRILSLVTRNNFIGFEDYLTALKKDNKLFNEFMNFITINVTEFYRNPNQWEILQEQFLPIITKGKSKMRIWSAACSTGDEPYTVAMIMREFYPKIRTEIIATDMDKEVLRKATIARYNEKSIENLPKIFTTKYLNKDDEHYVVKDEIKSMIKFQTHNLLKDEFPKDLDLIICRNVVIYFTEEAKADIYSKFSKNLNEDGILFIGNTEQIINAKNYNLETLKTFFYKKSNKI